jgi:DNA repair protein RadC
MKLSLSASPGILGAMTRGYPIPKEEFLIVGVDDGEEIIIRNPETGFDRIEVPLGEFEDLRVRVGLVRSPDYDEFEPYRITQSEDIYRFVRNLDFEPQETFGVVLLDTQNKVLGYQEVFRGGLTETAIEPKLLFQAPILADATSIILVHNHPSGNPEPSVADRNVTLKIQEAATMLGFRVLDHVIVGVDAYTSLADRGML